MSESGSISDIIVQKFKNLRNTYDYSEVFEKLSGISVKYNEAKACLIQLVLIFFGEETDNYQVKRDVVLASWSLLSEYSGISEIMERRNHYILDTAFKGRNTHDASFRKLDPKSKEYEDTLRNRRDNLLKYEDYLYEKLVEYFSSNYTTKKDKERLIDSAKDKWISKDTGEVLLPSRFYNEPSSDDDITINRDEDSPTDTSDEGEKIKTINKPKRKTVIPLLVIAVVIIITGVALVFLLTDKTVSNKHLTPEEFDRAMGASVETQATPFPDTLKFISAESEEDYKTYNDLGDSDGGRQIYTSEDINKGVLENSVVFNSVSDGAVGDERKFVGARLFSNPENKWINDTIEVQDGETYTVCLYVHNDNPNGLDAIANNSKASFSLPTDIATSLTVTGYLDSTNAVPNRYWDTVTFKSDEFFYLEYVTGSAKFINGSMGTVNLEDDIIFSGHPLGYDRFDGNIPGGDKYAGVVTIEVKIHKSVTAKLKVYAHIKGTKEWNDDKIQANIGDVIEYKIEYKNLKNENVKDVMIKDILPTNVTYIKGSTLLYNDSHQTGISIKSDKLIDSGINIGDYDSNGNAIIVLQVKVTEKTMAEGENRLVNWANVTVQKIGSDPIVYKDDVSIIVNK